MRSLLVFLLFVFVPVAAAAGSFRPVYEHGSGELIPDVEYGSTDESDAAFVMSTWIDFDVAANGGVYLLECTLCLVKQFNADGELVNEFGEEGEGPGYLRMPSQIAVGPDGRVWIYELGNRRFSVFTAGGEFIETYHFSDVVWDMDVSSRGTVYARVQLADRKGEWGGSRHRLLRFSGDMARQTVVDSAVIKDNLYITEPVRINVPVPFCNKFLWGLSPEGNVVVATTEDFRLKALSQASGTIYDVRHEIDRLEVTGEDRENHFGNITTSSGGVVRKGAPDYIRNNTEFPGFKPAFRSMLVDHEGYVLLQTYEEDENRQVWLVFEPDGRFLGRMSLAPRGVMLSGGYVYGLNIRDDYSSVERMRLVIPGQDEKRP